MGRSHLHEGAHEYNEVVVRRSQVASQRHEWNTWEQQDDEVLTETDCGALGGSQDSACDLMTRSHRQNTDLWAQNGGQVRQKNTLHLSRW